MTSLTYVALTRKTEELLEGANSYNITPERGENYIRTAAVYAQLARTASDREQRAQIIGDVGSPPPPRRLLCYRCVSEATEGQVIQEAMTIVNGTALCHEHGEDRLAVANRGGPKC